MTREYKIGLLASVAFKINHLADGGRAITEDCVRKEIENRSLFDFLQKNYRNPPSLANDFSSLTEYDKNYLYNALENIANCYLKEEDCCVKNNDFCLLVAFLLMCIQTECGETDTKLDISKKDRLILYNQFKILNELCEGEDYKRLMKIVEYGYALHYDELLPYLNEDEFPAEDSRFVIDVLDMYSAIYSAWSREKAGLQEMGVEESDVIFPGFDGNNETSYLAYCEFFIEDLDRFQDIKKLKNGEYNSHMEMNPKYKKMVAKWKFIPTEDRYKLTASQVSNLVNTKGYEQ